MRGVLASIAILFASALPAWSDDIPKINVDAYCASPVAVSLGGSKACRKAEKTALDALRANWKSYPKQRKHFCVQSVTFLRKDKRSYIDLAECLGESRVSSSS